MGNKGCGELAEGAHVAATGFLPFLAPPHARQGLGPRCLPALRGGRVGQWKSFWPPTEITAYTRATLAGLLRAFEQRDLAEHACVTRPCTKFPENITSNLSFFFLERTRSFWSPWTPNIVNYYQSLHFC